MEAQVQISIASAVQVVSFTSRPLYLRRKCPWNLLDKTHVGHRACFEDVWGTGLVLKIHVGYTASFEDTFGAQRLFWWNMWGTEFVLKTCGAQGLFRRHVGHRACFEDTCEAQRLFWWNMWGTELVLKTCGAQGLIWRHKKVKHRHFRFSQLSGRHLHRLTLRDSGLLGSEDRGSTILRHVGSFLRAARCKSQKS